MLIDTSHDSSFFKRCSKGDGKNIAGSNFSHLLIFVFITFGNRLRNDGNSKIKTVVRLMKEGEEKVKKYISLY